MLFEVSSQFIARFNHRGLNFVSEEFVEATDSTAQPAVAIWTCYVLIQTVTARSRTARSRTHTLALGCGTMALSLCNERNL